jgi:hypothetical protein
VAAAQPAAAQPALVAVPPGCGSLSGTMVAANTIADFSASPVGVAFQAPAVANHITVGSQFQRHRTTPCAGAQASTSSEAVLGTSDFADPQAGGAVCTAVENEAVPC